MSEINVNCIRVGMIATNCYIVYDDERREALIVDPGDNAYVIKQVVEQLNVKPVAVLLTHAHYDHIMGVPDVKKEYNIPVFLHKDDELLLEHPEENMGVDTVHLQNDDTRLEGGETLELGGMEVQVIHTPGHTMGGVCYYIPEGKLVFAGDTIFRHSWGRTDFYGGSEDQLFHSIYTKVLKLPEDTTVFPGHDAPTTVGDERKFHDRMHNR